MKKIKDFGYNERLFSSGLRSRLHYARYELLKSWLAELNCATKRVLELGCFDGKAINFLPTPPEYYLGFDANWEGGLSIAREKWKDNINYVFRECTVPEQMDVGEERFDVSICMETLEHLPPETVSSYLGKLANSTENYLFVTIPNETGPFFFVKHLIKAMVGDTQKYELSELFHQTIGNTERVERDQHKGFNYKNMVQEISNHFEIQKVSGYPLTLLPPGMNYGIGIIAKKRHKPGGFQA